MSQLNIAVTCIIIDPSDKVLITRRHKDKKKWPGKWTLPGGQLEDTDYIGTPTKINNQWYGTLENCVRREVLEETGITLPKQNPLYYLCNIAVPGTLIVSFFTYTTVYSHEYKIVLQENECDDYAWIDFKDVKKYDLIDGIEGELREVLGYL